MYVKSKPVKTLDCEAQEKLLSTTSMNKNDIHENKVGVDLYNEILILKQKPCASDLGPLSALNYLSSLSLPDQSF